MEMICRSSVCTVHNAALLCCPYSQYNVHHYLYCGTALHRTHTRLHGHCSYTLAQAENGVGGMGGGGIERHVRSVDIRVTENAK